MTPTSDGSGTTAIIDDNTESSINGSPSDKKKMKNKKRGRMGFM